MTDYAELCERLRELDSDLGHAVWDRGCQSCALASNTISQAAAAIERLSAENEASRDVLADFVRVYDGFEDGNGDPCPIIIRARTILKGADHD